jgi:hypothetical protein
MSFQRNYSSFNPIGWATLPLCPPEVLIRGSWQRPMTSRVSTAQPTVFLWQHMHTAVWSTDTAFLNHAIRFYSSCRVTVLPDSTSGLDLENKNCVHLGMRGESYTCFLELDYIHRSHWMHPHYTWCHHFLYLWFDSCMLLNENKLMKNQTQSNQLRLQGVKTSINNGFRRDTEAPRPHSFCPGRHGWVFWTSPAICPHSNHGWHLVTCAQSTTDLSFPKCVHWAQETSRFQEAVITFSTLASPFCPCQIFANYFHRLLGDECKQV